MPTQRKRELFFRRFDSSRLAKTRAFPSALLRLAKDAPARRRVRSMKPRVISTRKTREVRWRPARARFRTEFVPRNVFVTLFFFGSKSAIRVNTHTKKRSITILSPKRLFSRKARPTTTTKKTRGETEFFFRIRARIRASSVLLEFARGRFFWVSICRVSDEVNSSPAFFFAVGAFQNSPKKERQKCDC